MEGSISMDTNWPAAPRTSFPTPTSAAGRRSRRSRGQTMTDFALVSAVLLPLLFGVLESGLLLFSVGSARFAAGEAARQEAEAGNAANADALTIGIGRGTGVGT